MTILAHPIMQNPEAAPPADDVQLKEANHRIANQLTLLAAMIQMEGSAIARGPEMLARGSVKALFDKMHASILAMGRLHRQLAAASEEPVDLAQHLVESSTSLISALALTPSPGLRNRLSRGCRVTGEQAQFISLIVGEIILNAVKHAHPTGIPVQIQLACNPTMDGRILIEICDDGVGLPEGFDSRVQGGLGFKLIRLLAERLNADLRIESDSLGLCFLLLIPKPH